MHEKHIGKSLLQEKRDIIEGNRFLTIMDEVRDSRAPVETLDPMVREGKPAVPKDDEKDDSS